MLSTGGPDVELKASNISSGTEEQEQEVGSASEVARTAYSSSVTCQMVLSDTSFLEAGKYGRIFMSGNTGSEGEALFEMTSSTVATVYEVHNNFFAENDTITFTPAVGEGDPSLIVIETGEGASEDATELYISLYATIEVQVEQEIKGKVKVNPEYVELQCGSEQYSSTLQLNGDSPYISWSSESSGDHSLSFVDILTCGDQSLEDNQKIQAKINLELPYSYVESGESEENVGSGVGATSTADQTTYTITDTFDVSMLQPDMQVRVQVYDANEDWIREIATCTVLSESSGTYSLVVESIDGYEHGAFDEAQVLTLNATTFSFIYQGVSNDDFVGKTLTCEIVAIVPYEETHYENKLDENLIDFQDFTVEDLAALVAYAKGQGWIQ